MINCQLLPQATPAASSSHPSSRLKGCKPLRSPGRLRPWQNAAASFWWFPLLFVWLSSKCIQMCLLGPTLKKLVFKGSKVFESLHIEPFKSCSLALKPASCSFTAQQLWPYAKLDEDLTFIQAIPSKKSGCMNLDVKHISWLSTQEVKKLEQRNCGKVKIGSDKSCARWIFEAALHQWRKEALQVIAWQVPQGN